MNTIKMIKMSFTALLIANIMIALPTITYYYYWGIAAPKKEKHSNEEILKHLKRAYILTAGVILVVPSLLLWYLYNALLYLYGTIFVNTLIIIAVLVATMEYINFYSFENYEKKRFTN